MNVAVRSSGLALAYGERVALQPSSFELPRAAVTAIIGPNGSGKSTLLGAMAGLIDPQSGTLEVLGRPPAEVRKRVAYVLQSTKVNELMPVTAREVVCMGRYARRGSFGRFHADDRRAVSDALEQLDITRLAERHLDELSGGQRQRVFVAQGLSQRADLLLLDEPITGLDFVSREAIRRAMLGEVERGGTVVVTTHDLSDAGEADYVVLVAGRVVAQGPPAEVLTPDLLAEAYGLNVLHMNDGSVMLDDPHHRPTHQPGSHFHGPIDMERVLPGSPSGPDPGSA